MSSDNLPSRRPVPIEHEAEPWLGSDDTIEHDRPRGLRINPTLGAIAWLAGAMASWWVGVAAIDPEQLTDIGIVSVAPPSFYLGLAMIVLGILWLVARAPQRAGMIGTYLVALAVAIHATAPLAYDTVRYSWSWKHIGVVDYIQRNDSVDPNVANLDVYHNWPGFFALNALFNDLVGIDSSATVALWTPVIVNLLALGALLLVFDALTDDRRIVWLGATVFILANWVGQDYFAPQAFAFVLYLVAIGVLLRWFRTRSDDRVLALPSGLAAARRGAAPRPGGDPYVRTIAVAGLAVISLAIVSSHALTSVMLALAVSALVALGAVGPRWLPLGVLAAIAFWSIFFSRTFIGRNIGDVFPPTPAGIGADESKTADFAALSSGQVWVTAAARALVIALVLLALASVARLIWSRQLTTVPLALAALPLLLGIVGDYDGELVFRIYLFSSPFLAYYAARTLVMVERLPDRVHLPVQAGALIALLLVFTLAHFGKDGHYRFSPEEVAAAELVHEAAPGTLLVEGTRNYPGLLKNYERFTYVPLDREDGETQERVRANPAEVLGEWLSDPKYPEAYVILTRSQKAEADQIGALPKGMLDRIEGELRSSPAFRTVFDSDDAVVLTLTSRQATTR
jgi:hypothetical protein